MISHTTALLRRLMTALTLALAVQGAAHAGLVTGNWDPQFGSFLPGLSWQVRAELLVPDACSNQADGIYGTGSGACQIAGSPFVNVWLRLFDTGLADPGDFFGSGGISPNHSSYWILTSSYTSITNIRIASGQVVAFGAGSNTAAQTVVCTNFPICNPLESFPSAAGGNLFELTFDTNGPKLACLHCRHNIADPMVLSDPDIYADTSGLSQFLVTYTSTDTSTPKFTDDSGHALGARLDGAGNYRGQGTTPLPEPGTVALLLAALGAAAVTTRRRRG